MLIGVVIKVADIAEKFSLQLHLKINLELFLSEVVYQSLLSISFFYEEIKEYLILGTNNYN